MAATEVVGDLLARGALRGQHEGHAIVDRQRRKGTVELTVLLVPERDRRRPIRLATLDQPWARSAGRPRCDGRG